LDMINDNIRAERLANIDLNQSRVATVIQFEADYSGIQTDVGDVIKLTNNLYGWTDKLFRVMRVTENSDDSGMITAQISAMEYSDDYYGNPVNLRETPDIGVIDLPRIPIIGPIPIPSAFSGYSNVTPLPDVYKNVITNDTMKTFGAGTQLTDQPANNTSVTSGTTFLDITTPEFYDMTGADKGDYEFTSVASLGGAPTTTYDLGFQHKIQLNFANSTAANSIIDAGGGVEIFNQSASIAPPPLRAVSKISTDPSFYGFASDMKIQSANVTLQGYSDITESNVAPRTFAGMNYQVLRVTKGEII